MTTFYPPLDVHVLEYGWIYKNLCGEAINNMQHEMTIGNFLACTCMDFITMISSSLGK
jgi:hypothetical protein